MSKAIIFSSLVMRNDHKKIMTVLILVLAVLIGAGVFFLLHQKYDAVTL